MCVKSKEIHIIQNSEFVHTIHVLRCGNHAYTTKDHYPARCRCAFHARLHACTVYNSTSGSNIHVIHVAVG